MIDVKFGDFNHTFPGVTKNTYLRLLNYFNINEQELVTIYLNNNIKKVMTSEGVTYKYKRCINYIYKPNYNVHYFINDEQTIDEPQNFNSSYSKDKLKNIYRFNDKLTLTLSDTTIKSEDKLITAYEVELKYTTGTVDKFLKSVVKQLVKLIQNTDVLYDTITFNNVKRFIFDKTLVKCQNINLKNINYDTTYVVSTKAKGMRCMLVILNGVWLIKPPNYYNLIINTNNMYFNYFINSFNFTIFDGEVVTPINKNSYEFNYKYWYLCYDCLYFSKSDVRALTYGDRIDKALAFKSLISWYIDQNLLCFSLKTTRSFNDKNSMYVAVRHLLNLQSVLNYNFNGLIFIDANTSYDEKCYKWVYPSMTTIDFALYPEGNNVKLYLYNEQLNKDVPFTGTNTLPFSEVMILDKPITKKVIGECKWDQILNKMVLVKIRSDKDNADDLDLAVENWKNMNEPINCYN